ncbi:MAG: T9SS type A sorting domain-containing protein [Bacteroidota bacterium]
MKHISLVTALFVLLIQTSIGQTYRLGADLDGFAFGTAERTETYGGSTYQFWEKEATGTGTGFLIESDGFANKWQNGSVGYDQQETLFFGDGASPDARLASAPTVGNNYVFKIRENGYANLASIVMELDDAPVTIDNVSQMPSGGTVPAGEDLTVTATLSAAPSSQENIFLRYSFDGFATYGTLTASATPTSNTQTFTIPGQSSGTTVTYYLFSTTLPQGTLSGDGSLTDLATIYISNNSGSNFAASFPVEFADIQIGKKASGHQLQFSTASETNNSHFEIERSTDSRQWRKLGSIAGAGTTQAKQDYTFFDAQPALGLNYYRIKQVDFDGTFSYSNIVSANWADKPIITLYPNPAHEQVQINGLGSMEEEVIVEVLDLRGKVMLRQVWNQANIDLQNVPAGLYVLQLSTASGLLTQERIIIQ